MVRYQKKLAQILIHSVMFILLEHLSVHRFRKKYSLTLNWKLPTCTCTKSLSNNWLNSTFLIHFNWITVSYHVHVRPRLDCPSLCMFVSLFYGERKHDWVCIQNDNTILINYTVNNCPIYVRKTIWGCPSLTQNCQ